MPGELAHIRTELLSLHGKYTPQEVGILKNNICPAKKAPLFEKNYKIKVLKFLLKKFRGFDLYTEKDLNKLRFQNNWSFFVSKSVGNFDIHSNFMVTFDGEYEIVNCKDINGTQRKIDFLTSIETVEIVIFSSFEGRQDLNIHCHKMR